MECKKERISATHRKVYTEINIKASPKKIWDILMNNEELAKWSTSFQGMEGDIKKGGKVIAYMVVAGKPRKIKHTLTEFEEEKIFAWSDPFMPGVQDNHNFIIEKISDNECKFIQKDQAKGPMVLLLGGMLSKTMCKLYTNFNQKLKIAAEKD